MNTTQFMQDLLTGDFTLMLAEQLKEALDIVKNKSPTYDNIHRDWIEGLVTTWFIRKTTNESSEIIDKIEKEIKLKNIDTVAIEKLYQFKELSKILERKFNDYGIKNYILDATSLVSLLDLVKDDNKFFTTFRT